MDADEATASPAFEWGPTINDGLCNGCGVCADFCRNGVFEARDGKVRVAAKTKCVPGCSHCASLCEQGAISFPTVEEIKRWRARPARS